MASTSFISVPPPFRAAVALVARMGDSAFEELATRLEAAPNFAQVAVLAEALRGALPVDDAVQSERLAQSLISLAPQVVDDESSDVPVGISNAPEFELSADERASFAGRLERLLRTQAVATTAKALQLLTQNERNYQSARVVSDIRPVFGTDITAAPAGAVITEVLQLRTWSADGETDTHYVAMDEADILELRDVLERALVKTQTLRDLLRDREIQYFELDPRD
jgi:hypothetical protein